MEIKTKPTFICFTTEMKKTDGEGSMSIIARIEDLDMTDEQIMAVKAIQERAASEVKEMLAL